MKPADSTMIKQQHKVPSKLVRQKGVPFTSIPSLLCRLFLSFLLTTILIISPAISLSDLCGENSKQLSQIGAKPWYDNVLWLSYHSVPAVRTPPCSVHVTCVLAPLY